jgi:hypothetical protein
MNNPHKLNSLSTFRGELHWGELDGKPDDHRPSGVFGVEMGELRVAVLEAESQAVGEARRKVAELREEHRTYTRNWAKATDEMQGVLKQEIERLEGEIREWEPRTVPLSRRLEGLYAAEAERQADRERLLADWPALEHRAKGEAMRRLFNRVTLFWDKEFRPASSKPTRPRRTNRPGRYRYTLRRDRIVWDLATSDLGTSW